MLTLTFRVRNRLDLPSPSCAFDSDGCFSIAASNLSIIPSLAAAIAAGVTSIATPEFTAGLMALTQSFPGQASAVSFWKQLVHRRRCTASHPVSRSNLMLSGFDANKTLAVLERFFLQKSKNAKNKANTTVLDWSKVLCGHSTCGTLCTWFPRALIERFAD